MNWIRRYYNIRRGKMKLNFTKTTLKRPITADELKEFSKIYLYDGIGNKTGREIIADTVLDNFDFENAVEVANNDNYSIQTIEKELKTTLRRMAGVGIILAGFSMAGKNKNFSEVF